MVHNGNEEAHHFCRPHHQRVLSPERQVYGPTVELVRLGTLEVTLCLGIVPQHLLHDHRSRPFPGENSRKANGYRMHLTTL
jgi:hypothetical protein